MVHGCIVGRIGDASNETVRRIIAETKLLFMRTMSEVERNRLSDDFSHGSSPRAGQELELPIVFLGKSQIGYPISRHGNTKVSPLVPLVKIAPGRHEQKHRTLFMRHWVRPRPVDCCSENKPMRDCSGNWVSWRRALARPFRELGFVAQGFSPSVPGTLLGVLTG